MIKARGKRTVHFHRLPRLSRFFFQHLRTFPARCIVAGRRCAGRDEQDDESSNEDIASRCCLVRARCPTWASQETRALEDIAERSPSPPPHISPFYINRDNRASVTGQWPGLRPRISFVGSRRRDATPSIDACNTRLTLCVIVKIGMKRVFRVVPNVMRKKAYPLHLPR